MSAASGGAEPPVEQVSLKAIVSYPIIDHRSCCASAAVCVLRIFPCSFFSQLQAEVETLKKEVEKLRKNGTDVVEAYNRKKERADELLETLVALRQASEGLSNGRLQ